MRVVSNVESICDPTPLLYLYVIKYFNTACRGTAANFVMRLGPFIQQYVPPSHECSTVKMALIGKVVL